MKNTSMKITLRGDQCEAILDLIAGRHADSHLLVELETILSNRLDTLKSRKASQEDRKVSNRQHLQNIAKGRGLQ
jgi:hypothetical protein